MKPMYIKWLACLMLISLTGCANHVAVPGNTPKAPVTTPGANPEPTLGQMISKMYTVKGKVVQVEKTSEGLAAVTLTITENVKEANSAVSDPDSPFKIGSTQNFVMENDQSPDSLNLKPGKTLTLHVGQFAAKDHPDTIVWGSKVSWIQDVH